MSVSRLRAQLADDESQAARFRIMLDERREAKDLKDADRAKIAEFDKQIKLVGTSIGNPDMSVETLKSKSPEVKEMWTRAAGSNSLGDSFAEATAFIASQGNLHNMRRSGRAEFADMQQAFQHKIRDESEKLSINWKTLYSMSTKPPTNKEIWKIAADQLEKDFYSEAKTNMTRASTLNPYRVDHKLTIRDWTGDPSNPVMQMIDRAMKNGEQLNDSILFGAVQKQVELGAIAPKVAAQALSEYYTVGIGRNNRTRDFTSMGLTAQENYMIINGKNSIDLSNQLQLEKAFTAQRAAVLGSAFREGQSYGRMFGPAATPKKESQLVFEVPTK
jgi:hypothetical protein